jgi:hypothetical protein
MFPYLLTSANNDQIPACLAIQQELLLDLFTLPMSEIAFEELHSFEESLLQQEDTLDHDVWNYIWGQKQSLAKSYAHLKKI